jgi:hypothetical protein
MFLRQHLLRGACSSLLFPVSTFPPAHNILQVEALEKAAAAAKKTRAPRDVPDIVTMRKSDLERMVKVRRNMLAFIHKY